MFYVEDIIIMKFTKKKKSYKLLFVQITQLHLNLFEFNEDEDFFYILCVINETEIVEKEAVIFTAGL